MRVKFFGRAQNFLVREKFFGAQNFFDGFKLEGFSFFSPLMSLEKRLLFLSSSWLLLGA
jgi:hypothetical protein